MSQSPQSLTGWILGPEGWRFGTLRFTERLLGFEADASRPASGLADPPAAPGEALVLPGFIDLHVHGGGGADVMDGGDAMLTIAMTHARHGTTSMLATTMTAPTDDIDQAFRGIAQHMAAPSAAAAQVLGVHLEGPYINEQRLGAQPGFCVPGSLEQVLRWSAMAPIRVVTLAPEVEGNLELVGALVQRGIRVQMGHSAASYELACQALQAGLSGFTHLFNAMGAMHQRGPGVVGAALAHAEYAELITDLITVHPGAIRVALRCVPKLYAVTDATAAAGMPDGEYTLGRQRVHKCLGAVRLADGTLAGSALTTDQSLRNLVALPLSLAQASLRLSRYPADYLGLERKGRIAVGCDADLVVLERDLEVQSVYVGGWKV
jgi:N-acetylglucosamine-6-phosphate deacetylase